MFRLLSTCYSGRHLASRLCLAVFHRGSVTGGGLERLQRLCLRLEQLQRRVKCQRPESFTVGNETFQIPVRTVSPPAEPPQRQELEYLVGFFDGDGSVSLNSSDGHVRLQIDQSIDSAQVLVRYQRALGGAISLSLAPTGRNKACLKWRVVSANAGQVAGWLATITSMKQAQLEIAAGGHVVPLHERNSVARMLKEFKLSTFTPAAYDCSWPYFTGFFDADGTIIVGTQRNSLALKLSQVNPFGPSQLLKFLHEQGHTRWRLNHTEHCVTLSCTELAACRKSLELLLENGLLVKKEQAELALTLTAGNHKQVREAMSKLKGHQNRYRRLDEAGMDRAKQIILRSGQLQRTTCPVDSKQREEELQALRQEHIRLNLICKANTIRGDIRRHLREGATILPYSLLQDEQRMDLLSQKEANPDLQ